MMQTEDSWEKQFEDVLAHFHAAFAGTPAAEVEQDLQDALTEIRRSREKRECADKRRLTHKTPKA